MSQSAAWRRRDSRAAGFLLRIAARLRPLNRPFGNTDFLFSHLVFERPKLMGSRAKLYGLVAIAITASSAFAGERKPVRSLLEIRQEGVIVQKWETSCAAAALATVLTYSQN